MSDTGLSGCRVVLVRPQFAGNVGAVARVMRNMGLCDLVLVAPEANIRDRQARFRLGEARPTLRNEPLDVEHVYQARPIAEQPWCPRRAGAS